MSLERPVSPFVVGDQIRDIIEADAPKFRYPVGPDAEIFINMRKSATDEAWIESANVDDETWAARIQAGFGIDPRPYLNRGGAS